MALLSVASDVVGWLLLAVVLLAPGAVASVLWAPFLASARIRSLFEHLPPFESTLRTYVFVAVAASLPFVVGVGTAVAAAGSDAIWGPPILLSTLAVSLCYVVGVPVVAAWGLPRIGIDWDPTGYGPSTWAILLAGGAWYALLFAAPLAVLGLVLSLPGGY